MTAVMRYLAVVICVLGILSIAMGSTFIVKALDKNDWMKDRMKQEKITLGLSDQQVFEGDVVDNAAELQNAADTIVSHRREIAPTYNDLTNESGGNFDPTNPTHVTYMQAMNLENYLYLGVLGFGVISVIIGTGVFMIVAGIALVLSGSLLWRRRRHEAYT